MKEALPGVNVRMQVHMATGADASERQAAIESACQLATTSDARLVLLPSYASLSVTKQQMGGGLSHHFLEACTQPMVFVPFLDSDAPIRLNKTNTPSAKPYHK